MSFIQKLKNKNLKAVFYSKRKCIENLISRKKIASVLFFRKKNVFVVLIIFVINPKIEKENFKSRIVQQKKMHWKSNFKKKNSFSFVFPKHTFDAVCRMKHLKEEVRPNFSYLNLSHHKIFHCTFFCLHFQIVKKNCFCCFNYLCHSSKNSKTKI